MRPYTGDSGELATIIFSLFQEELAKKLWGNYDAIHILRFWLPREMAEDWMILENMVYQKHRSEGLVLPDRMASKITEWDSR